MKVSLRSMSVKASAAEQRERNREHNPHTFLSQMTHSSCVQVFGSAPLSQHHIQTSLSQSSIRPDYDPGNVDYWFYDFRGAVIPVGMNNHSAGAPQTNMKRKRRSIPPLGSWLGNRSSPQILQAATPVIIAAKARNGPCADC